MKKLLPILMLAGFSSPAFADITHSITSSIQLNVNAAGTQVERIGNSYSVSGTNIDVTTLGGMTADTDGVASFADGTYAVATDATTWAFTENFTTGDTIASSAPTVGEVSNYSNQTSTAAGAHTFTDTTTNQTSELEGTISSVGGISDLSAGGPGTSAIGQVVTSLTIQ